MNEKNPTREWIATLLTQFAGQENTLTINRAYITLTGSLEAALLLSQIIYWTDRSTMIGGWFAKSYTEWEQELTLSEYQVRKSIKALNSAGIETKLKHFIGVPTLHYRLNKSVFSEWILKKLQNGNLNNLSIDPEEILEPLTEPTAEPTTENFASNDAAIIPPHEKPKRERILNPVFDAVALGSFQLSEVNGDKQAGARIGKIVAWLKDKPDATAERVTTFYRWYCQQNPNTSAPRDVAKFAEWWLKFDAGKQNAADPFAAFFANVTIIGGVE